MTEGKYRNLEIPEPNSGARKKASERQDQLTKPRGSLGKLEEIAIWLAGVKGLAKPRVDDKVCLVFAADHGVVEEGVSAYPQEVTAQMFFNFLQGGAAINVLARQVGARMELVDIGVRADLDLEGVRSEKIRPGTANMARGPAMSRREAEASLEVGFNVAEDLKHQGVDIIGLGEMGIGNTTASSAVLAALTHRPLAEIVGPGTGIPEDKMAHKIQVIKGALELNSPDPDDPVDVLAKVGGLELGGMAGTILGAAYNRLPVIVDGFISSVALLIASSINPSVRGYTIASHSSQEPGHGPTLSTLGIKPPLELGMRLGEGTGAALMMNVVEAATLIQGEMATFAEASVSDK